MEVAMLANIIMLIVVGGVAWYVNTRIKSQRKHANTIDHREHKKPDFSKFNHRAAS